MINVAGVLQLNTHALPPYSDLVCDFLDCYSDKLRHDKEARTYGDVMSFAFWARKGNIITKKKMFEEQSNRRIGRGVVFHIAPSNVPVNCMFSYAFGLLSGNSNIVKIPSADFASLNCMIRVLKDVLEEEAFSVVKEMTSFVKYDRSNDSYTHEFSLMCDVRVIWGGDATVNAIRKILLPPRSIEITFADRYSFGIVDVATILEMSDDDIEALSHGFYNDTYLMDQNACSSPHLILFYKGKCTIEDVKLAQNRFWNGVYEVSKKYELADIMSSDKYLDLCEHVMSSNEELRIESVKRYTNKLQVVSLSDIPTHSSKLCRGRYGMFYECVIDSVRDISKLDDKKLQTCAVYGIDEKEILNHVISSGMYGIDRIVPFGKTLDIDTVWDGFDIIETMSRIIG